MKIARKRSVRWLVLCATGVGVMVLGFRASRVAAVDLRQSLQEAMRRGDEAEIVKISREAQAALGDKAGEPEEPDAPILVPKNVPPLTVEEAQGGFKPYVEQLPKRKWWKIGQDPTQTPHLAREAASVISGCVAASRAKLTGHQEALELAKDAADYLVWTQAQAGNGVFPFPNIRGEKGRAFESATRFLKQAEKTGQLDKVLRNGWAIDDLGDGGLQFDNGLAGVAVLELYELTNEKKYLDAAVAAADWAMSRPVCTNWNYNSFSVYLLAKVATSTGDKKYLDSAKLKARLGIYPGQLTAGPRTGRWADAHNAKPAYHYILLRGIAVLAKALPKDDPARSKAVDALSLGLRARNPDFAAQGVINKDSAVDALIEVLNSPLRDELKACENEKALSAIESLLATEFRKGKPPVAPGIWGKLLEYKVGQTPK